MRSGSGRSRRQAPVRHALLALLLQACGTPAPDTAATLDEAGFCAALTPIAGTGADSSPDSGTDTGADSSALVGVACVPDPTPGSCADLDVVMVQKGDVDGLCADCAAEGLDCTHSPAVDCTTTDGRTLSVYSFRCGGS